MADAKTKLQVILKEVVNRNLKHDKDDPKMLSWDALHGKKRLDWYLEEILIRIAEFPETLEKLEKLERMKANLIELGAKEH